MSLTRKHLGILGKTDPAEPTVNVQVESLSSTQRQVLKKSCVIGASVIPRGFSNQPWIRHVDANYSTAA
jgi:hypothetical protein